MLDNFNLRSIGLENNNLMRRCVSPLTSVILESNEYLIENLLDYTHTKKRW